VELRRRAGLDRTLRWNGEAKTHPHARDQSANSGSYFQSHRRKKIEPRKEMNYKLHRKQTGENLWRNKNKRTDSVETLTGKTYSFVFEKIGGAKLAD